MNSTYKSSGVNINKGERLVDIIKPLVKSTFSKNVLSGIGNFGAFYKIPKGYLEPIFVSSTDGVGTKLKIAINAGIYNTIGQDLVNHCVNDIAVCGATPLFFLDYMAFGKLNNNIASKIIEGLVIACKENLCSLIGGETAEMPGLYSEKDFDLAGTIVGIVETKNIINKKSVKKGDVLIGLRSNGLHTNGYSLVRKVLFKKYKPEQYIEELGNNIIDELLKVHKSYYKIIKDITFKFKVKSISHITGGGIEGNTYRVVPDNFKLNIDWNSWQRNNIFKIIQKAGNIQENEMRKVFNLGIGLIFIVSKNDADKVLNRLKKLKQESFIIGEIKVR